MNLRSVAGAKDFKTRVKNKLIQIDSNIKDDDLYFSQTATGYYLSYQPKYPESSNGDFIISQDLNGSISVYGNEGALIPTIKSYNCLEEFENS